MIKIDFIEPTTKIWKDWITKCKAETEELIESVNKGNSPSISGLYKEAKTFLVSPDSVFHGKCVYCETIIISNQPGDVEHYRPKGKVTDSNDKPIKVKISKRKEIDHPGYYWLAYDFKNLLPSCIDCNRPYKGNSGGILVGKWNQFPVKNFRAIKPKEEVDEEPLIINPCDIDPDEHIKIDETGVLGSKSIPGETTIRILGLNDRVALVNERKNTYDNVCNKMMALTILLIKNKDCDKEKKEIVAIKQGFQAYTIAARKAITDCQELIKPVSHI